MKENEKPAIDLEYAVKLIGGNRDLVIEIIADFRREIPTYLAEMAEQKENGDIEALVATIHKLGGGAAYAGAKTLRQMAKEIELDYKNNQKFDQVAYLALVDELGCVLSFDLDK